VAFHLVAWDKFRREEHLDDWLFVAVQLQIADILDLVEALECPLENKRWEEHCKAWAFAADVAAVALEVELVGLVAAAGTVVMPAVAHLVSVTHRPLLVRAVWNRHRYRCWDHHQALVWSRFRCLEPIVQMVVLARAGADAVFVTSIVPFHTKKDIASQDIGGLSLESYRMDPSDQVACNEAVALGARRRTFACYDL